MTPRVTFSLEKIQEAQGYSLALAGMVIVFTVLSLISIVVALLPWILDKLSPILPAEGRSYHHGGHTASTPGNEPTPQQVAALATALHAHQNSEN